MHKTLADPAVNLSRSFKLVRVLGGAGGRGRVRVGGMPQTHSPTYLSQTHKTLADPAVGLSRSFKLLQGCGVPCLAI